MQSGNCWPRAGVGLICGCSLAALFLFQYNRWRDLAQQPSNVEERFVAKYEPLRRYLPADEVIRFVVDEAHSDLAALHRDARLYLAQYAVSPRRLARDASSHWMVVDSDRADAAPEMAASAHWSLAADLGNGVRLYRRSRGE